jgi:hypothetical protein
MKGCLILVDFNGLLLVNMCQRSFAGFFFQRSEIPENLKKAVVILY